MKTVENSGIQGCTLALDKTVGSRPLASFGSILGGDWEILGFGVAVDWVTSRSCSFAIKAVRRLNVQSGKRKGVKGPAQPENRSERP